jgi:membrane-bound metal-dependent hydrolase YbcI (DUF457 family)
MNFDEHVQIGMTVGSVFLFVFRNQLLSYWDWVVGFILIFIFSILPDIDHQSSKITWALINIFTFGNVFLLALFPEYLPYGIFGQLIFLVINKMPHRGFMHTLTANIIIAIVMLVLTNNKAITVACFMSFWSHLFADKIPFKIRGDIL